MSQSITTVVADAARLQDAHRRQVELVKASLVACPGKTVTSGPGSR